MRHPSEGVLRRLVDEPAGVTDADRTHVASCSTCLRELDAVRADAHLVGAALASAGNGTDTDLAWARLSTAAASAPQRRQATAGARPDRWRAAVRRPAVAAMSAVLLLGGAGVAAANDWLPIFKTERVTPVEVTSTELVQVPDLSGYGDVAFTQQPETKQVPDARSAAGFTGLDVPRVTELPGGVTGNPAYEVAGQVGATFTFSAEKAAKAAAAKGEVLPPPPAGLDGSRFRLQAGPALAEVWSQPTGLPTLLVARAVAPTVDSSGVPFETARDYLLSLPGLPDGLAGQLRDLSADGGTLPLPVPAEMVTTSTAGVGGAEATVLTSRNGLFAGVVWVQDGVMTGVAGSLSAGELLRVARGLG
jgi:hypothetical protein